MSLALDCGKKKYLMKTAQLQLWYCVLNDLFNVWF